MRYLFLIWSNLKRKKLRSLLTILSILVAFVLYGYLAAIKVALGAGVDMAGADRLLVRHRVSIIQLLPVNYKERMGRIPGVALATHLTWFGGIYQNPRNFFPQMAVEPDDFLAIYPEYLLPKEAVEAWRKNRTGAIVGRGLARRFGWKVGDRVPLQATYWVKMDGGRTWEFDIVGIYDGATKSADTTQMFFQWDYFDEARLFAKGQVGWYMVRVKDPTAATETARSIDEEFANSPAETKAETEKAFLQGWAKQIGDIGAIMIAILSAVFFTILLVAGNTMAQSVRERIGELGVLKALGFTSVQVLALVLAESCLLACLGGFAGLGVALLMVSGGDPTGGALPVFFFPAKDVVAGVVMAVGLGLVTGLLPAMQAMRLRIADALRRM